MSDRNKLHEGYQPVKKSYQPPSPPPKTPVGDVGGYQPISKKKPAPNPPPNKP